jgi:hypothetical protein
MTEQAYVASQQASRPAVRREIEMAFFDALRNWWYAFLDGFASSAPDLPLKPEELARLIRSGKKDDFKKIAGALSQPMPRRPAEGDHKAGSMLGDHTNGGF